MKVCLENMSYSSCHSKTACAFDWQPGPDSIGIIAISHGCTGVASRACGLVGLEPTRVCFC